MVERPALDLALAEATERLQREFTEEAYAEQQRLLKRKLEFDARLGQMASARAASPSGHASNTMAE
jgi:DNA primase